jgi:hypothetical protein
MLHVPGDDDKHDDSCKSQAEQEVQFAAPGPENRPVGHVVHTDDPTTDEKLPAGHNEHDDPASAYEPIGQYVHFDENGPENEPAEHGVHVVEPSVEYVPAGQDTQVPDPVVE